ncbi:MAG: hypothetical protein ACI9QQ_002283 [Myxococcota bacterium]|jgi:hypothetical protein
MTPVGGAIGGYILARQSEEIVGSKLCKTPIARSVWLTWMLQFRARGR